VVDEPSAGPSPTAGNGIRNLSHRVGLLGGELTARAEDAGRYRLHATIPLRAAATASPPPSRSG